MAQELQKLSYKTFEINYISLKGLIIIFVRILKSSKDKIII